MVVKNEVTNMKLNIKKILSLIMTACMLFTLLQTATVPALAKSYTTDFVDKSFVDKSIDDLLHNYKNKADAFNYIQYLGKHYTSNSISNQIYSSMEMDKLSSSLVDDMLGNPLFVKGYSAWIASDLVINPAGVVEYLSRKTYYETIIFKVLQANMEVDTVIDWMNQKYIKDAMKLNKSLTDLADQKIYKYVVDNYDLSKLNEGELNELEKIVKNYVSVQKYNITGGNVEFVSDILKMSKNVEDFIKNTASYLLLTDVSDSTIKFLKELRSHSTDADLTESLDDVIAIYEDSFKDLLEKVVVEKIFFSTGKEVLKEALGKKWKSMIISKLTGGVLSNGAVLVNGALIGNAIGRTISDIAFSTNSKLDKFELMRSLSVFENVLENTLKKAMVSYDNTEASAQSLCSGVDLLYKTYEYDADLFIEMIRISEKDWIAPLYGDQLTEALENANSVKSYYQGVYNKITVSSGSCGNTVGWIVLDDGSLLIYGTGDMNDYVAEKTPWYGERDKIKEIYVSTGITRIGNYAFNNLINVSNMIVFTNSVECGSNCFDLLGKKSNIVSLNNMRFLSTHDIENDIDILGNLYCCTTQETHVNVKGGATVNVNGDAEFVTSPVYISVINSSIDINDGAILNVDGNMKVSGSSHPSSNWSFHWLSFYINGRINVEGDFSTGIKTYLYEQNSSGYLKVQGDFSQTDSMGELSAGTIEIKGDYNGKFTAGGDNTVILSGDKRQTITELKAKNLVIKNTSKEGINFNKISYCTGGVNSIISKIENGKNLYLSGGYFMDSVYSGDITLEKDISIENDIDILGNLYCCTTQETHVNVKGGATVNVNGDAEFVTSPVYISVINSSIDINDGAILNVDGNMKVSGSSHPSSNWSFHWLSFYINGRINVEGDFSTGIKTYLYEQNSSGYLKVQGDFSQTDSMGELSAGTIEIKGDYNGKFTAGGDNTVILSGDKRQTITELKAKNMVISNFSYDGIAFSNIPSNKLQFTVLCPNGYSKTSNYAVKADGLKIEPNCNDEYITETKSKTVITIEGVADITAPSAEIIIDEYQWSDFIDNISFDRFFNKGQDVIIFANDLGTGVSQVCYYLSHEPISKENIANVKDWVEYKDGIQINNDGRWIIYIKVSDSAGNIRYYSSNGIVLDSMAPMISGIENGNIYCEPQLITIDEPYLDTVTINGTLVNTVEDNKVLIPANGKQKIVISDKAGNSTELFVTVNGGHTGGKATCNELAKCTVCGKSYGDFGEHYYIASAKPEYLISNATCVAKAKYYKNCSVCGEKGSETFESGMVNAENHVGETYIENQKEATCYEEGYTGDKYCSDCCAKIESGTVIPKNAHNPADVWSTNDMHHWKECQTVGCGNIIGKTEHSGGEATCTEKAICSVCHVQYGNLNPDNHKNTEIRNAKKPSCSQDGYSGDTWCVDCQKQIGTGHSIPSTGKHVDADGEWESNNTQHFHTCACGVEFDQEDHSDGEATCSTKAICDVCKSEYGDFNTNNHKGSMYIKGQKEATCYEEGYTGDTYCSDCRTKIESGTVIPKNAHNPADIWSTNDTHHWKECQTVGCGNIIDKAEHSGGNATCKNKAICSICGVEYGYLNSENHVGKTEIKDVVEATCTTDGFTGNTYCKDCGAKIKNGDVIPAYHMLQKIDAKAATHDAEGNIEYYVCNICGAYFSDAAAENEITFDDTVIEKGEHEYVEKYDGESHWKECECGSVTDTEKHTFGDWVITQNATASENGSREKVCTICGYKITEKIPVPSDDGDTSNGETQQNNDGSVDNSKPNDFTSSPQTGDSSDIVLWIVLLAMSGFALVGASLLKENALNK